jgi:hypothetical protein
MSSSEPFNSTNSIVHLRCYIVTPCVAFEGGGHRETNFHVDRNARRSTACRSSRSFRLCLCFLSKLDPSRRDSSMVVCAGVKNGCQDTRVNTRPRLPFQKHAPWHAHGFDHCPDFDCWQCSDDSRCDVHFRVHLFGVVCQDNTCQGRKTACSHTRSRHMVRSYAMPRLHMSWSIGQMH